MTVNPEQAVDFVNLLFRDPSKITIQTFDDNQERSSKKLARVFQGLDESTMHELVLLNQQGAGVFVMVNEGDGKGRKAENVTAVNAVFVDLDGAPLDPVINWECPPHIVAESSPGHFHAFWLVSDCPLAQFASLQIALADKFNGDRKVHDVCRVMRLAGFLHQKGTPFPTHVVKSNPDLPRYAVADLQQRLEVSTKDREHSAADYEPFTVPATIENGERNDTLFRAACSLLGRQLSPTAVWSALVAENDAKCNPPLAEQELERILTSAQKYHPTVHVAEELPVTDSASETVPPNYDLESAPGILGEFTRAACRNSEADPAAVAATFLVRFGIECGPKPIVMVGDVRHSTRLNAVIVGDSSKSRKGTSAGPVKAFFFELGGCQTSPGPLSSGEGIIYAVRDEVKEWIINKKDGTGSWVITDPGIEDKRLFVLDEEFAYALAATRRDGNTLSSILRCLFDDGKAEPLTKSNRIRATNAHVGIVTHITHFELNKLLTQNEQLNGFGNRFIWIYARRHGIVPFPDQMDSKVKEALRKTVSDRLRLAQAGGVYEFSPEAKTVWAKEYPVLSMAHAGIAGCMVNRAEAMVIRLSLIFACMEGHRRIEQEDLQAAICFWRFCEDSALFIFGSNAHDRKEEKVIKALRGSPDHTLSKNDIRKLVFDNHINGDVLNVLIEKLKITEVVDVKTEQTGGAPKTLVTLKTSRAGNA